MFQGQTKEKLNNPEMTAIVDDFVRPALEAWLNANMTAAGPDRRPDRAGGQGPAGVARSRQRGQAQVGRRQRRLNLPGKLADCKSTDLDESELFIVEGDSRRRLGEARPQQQDAGGAAAARQDPQLRGAGRSAKVLANAELTDLVSAIGTGAGEKFDIERSALRQDHPADGRRRRRPSHHDADAGVLLPPHDRN